MSSYNAVAYIKIVSHYIRILNSYKTTSIYSNFEVLSFDFISLNKKFKLTYKLAFKYFSAYDISIFYCIYQLFFRYLSQHYFNIFCTYKLRMKI